MRRALALAAVAVAIALVISACGGDTHEPSGKQRQAVIDYVTDIYEHYAYFAQQRGKAIDFSTPGEILAKPDQLCREPSNLWWRTLDMAAHDRPDSVSRPCHSGIDDRMLPDRLP